MRRINEDYDDFRDVYAGRTRKELKKWASSGSIFRLRPKGGKLRIPIPRIDIPHIVFGDPQDGIGRGGGKKGDVVGKKNKGKGKGDSGATDDEGDGIEIGIDMEDVFKALSEDLELPDLKPKPNETFEDVTIKYNNLSMQGPESLRHNRKTMYQAMKRLASTGDLTKLHNIPGFAQPVPLITPINSDRRYRQYREYRVPSSNAVIFFARDGSGSMDGQKCDIVSDMAWWIEQWIRRFYKRTESCYVWHDSSAREVDQKKFYKLREGGGTICSSALNFIAETFEDRFPPNKWNIYVFYFTDGENFSGDNNLFNKILKEQFTPEIVNFVGVTQILSYMNEGSLKHAIDNFEHADNIRTTEIGEKEGGGGGFFNYQEMSEEDRDAQLRKGIIDLLGKGKTKEKKKIA